MLNAKLIDEIRELEAKAHGKRMELCQRLGDMDGMKLHMREMNALTKARRAAAAAAVETADCYFDACGHRDGLEARG